MELLEKISGYSAEEAKEELVESLKEDAKVEAMKFIQDTLEEAEMTAQKEAKKIIINTIQRIVLKKPLKCGNYLPPRIR